MNCLKTCVLVALVGVALGPACSSAAESGGLAEKPSAAPRKSIRTRRAEGTPSALPSAARLNELRKKAARLSEPAEGAAPEPEGWSKSRYDPNRLLELFQPLRLRKGYVLRAYLFREHGNGNGVVWAMPEDAEFPDPKDCPILETHLLKAPKPSEALDDAMEAVEGDDSPWSYLAASLLRRELREFGAAWHGCRWRTHFILDGDPWKAGLPSGHGPDQDRPRSKAQQWKWHQSRPANWAPQVKREGDRVTVTFYTYSALHPEGIYRHTDVYRAGKYRPRTEDQRIAEGPEGFLF